MGAMAKEDRTFEVTRMRRWIQRGQECLHAVPELLFKVGRDGTTLRWGMSAEQATAAFLADPEVLQVRVRRADGLPLPPEVTLRDPSGWEVAFELDLFRFEPVGEGLVAGQWLDASDSCTCPEWEVIEGQERLLGEVNDALAYVLAGAGAEGALDGGAWVRGPGLEVLAASASSRGRRAGASGGVPGRGVVQATRGEGE